VETSEQVKLDEIKPISNAPSVDLKKHDKKTVKIEKVEVLKVPSKFTDCGHQYVLKVSSQPVEVLGELEDLVEFRASELFNLIQDDTGKLIGYPTSDGSNLVQFMKDLGCDINKTSLKEIIEEIIGKEALIKAYDKEKDGVTKTYLKFRY